MKNNALSRVWVQMNTIRVFSCYILHLCYCLHFASYFQSLRQGLRAASQKLCREEVVTHWKQHRKGLEKKFPSHQQGNPSRSSETSSRHRQGKVWKSPVASVVQLPGGEGGQRVNKVSGRTPLHPPYSNKSLNFSESSKSPYPSGSKADLKQLLLTDYPLPESFLMHIS